MIATSASPRRLTVLHVRGLSSPSSVEQIQQELGRVPGVASARVKLASARVEVMHSPAVASTQDLVAAVAAAGYTARPSPF